MKFIKVKVSSKNQITLPKQVRKALHIEPGCSLVLVISKDKVEVEKLPSDLASDMLGLGKEVWEALGEADEYLRQERESWQGGP